MPQTQTPADTPVVDQTAEENLVGACLASVAAIEAAREQIEPADFYYSGLGTIYRTCLDLVDIGDPVDAVTVGARMRALGTLEDAGGEPRLQELLQIVPSVANAGHYARIVRDTARSRAAIATSMRLASAARNGGLSSHPEVIAELERLLDAPSGATTLRPLWWHDAIHEQIPETTEFVEDVLQTGILADIVGLPYLHKTAIALELATKVARGSGSFLGRYPITKQAPVAYFWADDSRAKELERIQAYSAAHDLGVLPLAMYLNPGLVLPDDIPVLKSQIREHGYRLVVFDSLYNFCPGIDFTKDHARVTTLYHALKRVCDQIDGLTIVLVDHAAKPSESNKGRAAAHSSFGSIFKAASVRCTIAVERGEKKGSLYVSATGNNIRGFERARAGFDQEALELRIVEKDETPIEINEAVETDIRERILGHLRKHPKDNSTNRIRIAIGKKQNIVSACLDRMLNEGILLDENAPVEDAQTTLDDPGHFTKDSSSRGLGTKSDEVSTNTPDDFSRTKSGRTRPRAWKIALDPSVQAETLRPGTKSEQVRPDRDSEVPPELRPDPSPPLGGEERTNPKGRIPNEDDDLPDPDDLPGE